MSVHYKFKAALEYSTITFDGIHITVGDLKKEIIDQKHLKQNDFDLQIMNAQTEEVYEDDNALIPKNTSVIVARLPGMNKRGTANGPGGAPSFHQRQQQHHSRAPPPTLQPAAVAKGMDLVSMDGTEEEKIKAMMKQSTDDYDPSKYVKLRGSGQHGRVPPSYRCNKCKNEGHWIKDCPMQSEHSDIKKSTGIPRSFMVHVDSPDVPGALMTPEGRFAVPAVDHAAYMEKNKPAPKPPPPKPKIPDELVCTLCDDLMTDALMVSCCATSYCDDCIRKALLESDDQECPGCHEKEISPTSLIPNRFLRSQVNAFKNKTGYSKQLPPVTETKKEPAVITVDLTDKKPEEPERRKLCLDELPDDLFPHSPRKIDPESDTSKEIDKVSATPVASTTTTGNLEEEEKTDLYDFNDTIPSPFASPPRTENQENEQVIRTIGTVNNFYSGQPHLGRHHHQQQSSHGPSGHPHPPPHHHRTPKDSYRQPRTPLQTGMPPLPSMMHQQQQQQQHPNMRRQQTSGANQSGGGSGGDAHEPPPPGFGDMLPLPPGEDRIPTPTGRGRDENLIRNEPMHRERNERNEMGSVEGSSRGSLLPLPAIPPFNPSQPPPGFNPSQSSGPPQQQKGHHNLPPPAMYSGPPPGSGPPPPMNMAPPNQNFPPYHGNYRLPPPGNGGHPSMFHPGGGPPMRGPHPRDRDRDSRYSSRERGMRKPPPREHRSRDRERPEEIRPGPIDDPLFEFERIMREKDRRKKLQQQQPLNKRSRSRSYSPGRRSPPSPFPKRSRSRSYSRSPSPKRKRPAPLRRRKSYSRTPSRSPPRRHLRSRSRSRNRSLTPSAPLSKRRSPRRAPPFSPSPPPSRFPPPRKEKDDFYDRPSRYDSSQSSERRYYPSGAPSGGSSSKPYSSGGRDYGEQPSKYDMNASSKYVDSQNKYDQLPPPGPTGPGTGKFDSRSGPASRETRDRDMYHHHTSSSGPPAPPSSFRDRDRNRDLRERDREVHRQVPYEFDPGAIPPGTEPAAHIQQSNLTVVPSLFELDIAPPSNFLPNKTPTIPPSSNTQEPYYHHPSSYHQHQQQSRHQQAPAPAGQKERRSHGPASDKEGDLESLSVSLTPDSELEGGSQKDRDGKRRHRKKSREGSSEKTEKRRDRKEKKKHKRKKEKEEKKTKKSKKLKPSDKPDQDDGSEDEQTTTTADETGPSRRSSITDSLNSSTKDNSATQLAQDTVKTEKLEIEKMSAHELDANNSNLTVIVCDSTVKSPERVTQTPLLPTPNISKDPADILNPDKLESNFAATTTLELDRDLKPEDVLGIDNKFIESVSRTIENPSKLPEMTSLVALKDHQDADICEKDEAKVGDFGDSKVDDFSVLDRSNDSVPDNAVSTKVEEIPVVSSKWDEFDEEVNESAELTEGEDPLLTVTDGSLGEGNGKVLKSTSSDKKVTSEVLKRAENAIFAKAISAISLGSSRSSSAVRRAASPPMPVTSKRKVYLETVEVTEGDKLDKSKAADGGDNRKSGATTVTSEADAVHKLTSSSTTVQAPSVKRSVRDRLGSKVTDDAVTTSSRRERSPVRDRDKDRQIKSLIGNAPTNRDRDRDRGTRKKYSKSRSRSPRRRSRSSRSKSKDRGRDREVTRGRYRPGGSSHRSRSRSRSKRSLSRRDRSRRSPRSRSRNRDVRETNRKRTPIRLPHRSRSASPHHGSNRDRQRDVSTKHAAQESSKSTSRHRAPDKDGYHPKEKDEREPSPPGVSDRMSTPPAAVKNKKTEEEEAWKKQANKFVPIGGAEGSDDQQKPSLSSSSPKMEENAGKHVESAWKQSGTNPVPLAVRKQKGRINIKLSSTTASKAEPGKSSSSSSDEDDQGKELSGGKDKSSGDSDDSRRDERKRKKDRKKSKRRRSESSSSTSSDDSAPRKSKKSKKKKKKSKKKKKVK